MKKALHYYHCALRANNIRTERAKDVQKLKETLAATIERLEAAALADAVDSDS